MIQKYLEDILERLSVSPAVTMFQVLKYRIIDEDGHLRVKCNLLNNDIMEMNEYVQMKEGRIEVKIYSFHWQRDTGELVKRWDNVAHHQDIKTYPSHVHIKTDKNVHDSEQMSFGKVIKILEDEIGQEEVR